MVVVVFAEVFFMRVENAHAVNVSLYFTSCTVVYKSRISHHLLHNSV